MSACEPCWNEAYRQARMLGGSQIETHTATQPTRRRRKTCAGKGGHMSPETAPRCTEHDDCLIWEPGGVDMPTIRGRLYCPTCQVLLMAALDNTSDPS